MASFDAVQIAKTTSALDPGLNSLENNNTPVPADDYFRLEAENLQNCSAKDIRVAHLNPRSLRSACHYYVSLIL